MSAEYRAAASTVGIRIRRAREAAGYSQERLALKIGTSRRNMLRWENGHNVPRVEHVRAIAEATGRPMDYFLGEDDEEEAALSADLAHVLHRLVGAAVREALTETSRPLEERGELQAVPTPGAEATRHPRSSSGSRSIA